MAENQDIVNNRSRYMERLKERYPEREYADDEELFGQINEDYDNYDGELSRYQEQEKALSDLFAANPHSAAFLTDWRNGEDPLISMVRRFGDDFKSALEDPKKREALAEANKEYAARVAEEAEYEVAYDNNIKDTLSLIESLQQEKELSDEEIDKAMDFLINIMRDGLLGKFSKESIIMALKAINHDADVEQADYEGEIRGRNSKIEEKLRKGTRNDGTANLAGKNGGGATSRQMPDLGALNRYDGVKSIWERGGEKRKTIK